MNRFAQSIARGMWVGLLLLGACDERAAQPPAGADESSPNHGSVMSSTVQGRGRGTKSPLVFVDPDKANAVTVVQMTALSVADPTAPNAKTWYFQPHFSVDLGKTWSSKPRFPVAATSWNGATMANTGDGSFLRVGAAAAARYHLPKGMLLRSSRVHDFVPDSPDTPQIGTWHYRIVVYGSVDGGATWTLTSHPALAATHVNDPARLTTYGLWANFLFERSDGVIFLTYDTQDLPAHTKMPNSTHYYPRGTQFTAARRLALPSKGTTPTHFEWTPEVIYRGQDDAWNLPANNTVRGMASMVEKCDGGIPYGQPNAHCTYYMSEEIDTIQQMGNALPTHGKVLISKSEDGALPGSWRTIQQIELSSPKTGYYYNVFAPQLLYHEATHQLLLVFRTDWIQNVLNPSYDPSLADHQAVADNNVSRVWGQSVLYRSTDGVRWIDTGYRAGGNDTCSNDPGIAQVQGTNEILVNYIQLFMSHIAGQLDPPSHISNCYSPTKVGISMLDLLELTP